jgi:hypothetical protein
LYKLYLVTSVSPSDKKGQGDPLGEFASQLLPALDRALAAKP